MRGSIGRALLRPPQRLATIDYPAMSPGPRCAIATSTATIRAPVDHPTIDHRERLWDRGVKSRPAHLRNFPKKNWKRARPPTSRHLGESLGTGVVIAIRHMCTDV